MPATASWPRTRDRINGKILRITQDGKAAPGNPFDNRTWSYGHRNIEGLAYDADGRLWATEFGERTADELNLIERGANYGWPDVEGRSDDEDFVNPKVTWGTDECSPAGLAITRSTAFLGALQGECLFAVSLNGEQVGKPKAHFGGDHGRIRTVVNGARWLAVGHDEQHRRPRRAATGRRPDLPRHPLKLPNGKGYATVKHEDNLRSTPV